MLGLLLLLIFQDSAFAQGTSRSKAESVGLLWALQKQKNQQLPSELEKLRAEREIVDEVENLFRKRVVKSQEKAGIPTEVFRLALKQAELRDLVRQLVPLALNVESPLEQKKEKGMDLNEEIKRMSSQLPNNTFGPEIQAARLAQAAWFWRLKQKPLFQRLCHEASEFHPQGDLDFTELKDQPLGEVFESECKKIAQVHLRKICGPLEWDVSLKRVEKIWLNGFLISLQDTKISSGSYLVIRKDQSGKWYESFIRCVSSAQPIAQGSWASLKKPLRVEHWIPTDLETFRNLVILAEEGRGIQKYKFALGAGVSHWGDDPPPIIASPSNSLTTRTEDKWYNISTPWWIAGAVVAGSAWWLLDKTPQPELALKIQIRNGP